MLNWIANFVVQMTFLQLVDLFGDSATWWVSCLHSTHLGFSLSKIYAAFSILILIFVGVFVPETKNVSLEELERKLVKTN